VIVILAFELRRMSFGIGVLLSGSKNKYYLCIRWCLFEADLILNLIYSHELTDVFGYG
jgi:hypothetical protein